MRQLLLLLFLFVAAPGRSQSLLLNGGFEEENICTEYKQNCAPEVWLSTTPTYPYFYEDPENAYEGLRYISVSTGNARMGLQRGFIRARLLCAPRTGAKYRLQLFVRTDYPGALDSMGVLFSPFDFLCNKTENKDLKATLYFRDATREPAGRGWIRYTFNYTGVGDEGYVVLGNFRRGEWNTGAAGRTERFQVFIDAVTLLPEDPYERPCKDWEQQKTAIYSENDRHQYQIRHMYSCSRKPQAPVVLPPDIIVQVDTLVVPDVLFNTASYEINRRAVALLDSLTRKVAPGGLDSVVVEGHTDSQGDTVYNQELSENRAKAVGQHLEYSLSIPVITRGYGPLRPVAENKTPAGRKRNRRVEIFLFRRV
ncbi:MAG: OmpA family protein [Chitinophagaceae bacterium]|nr:MAG: OmpA family protein [Chitinophagaceae bacterium]